MTPIEQAVGPLIGQIQTDSFCESCGYNLHTQAVMRDQRLGILVCRCPECGRYAAAGKSTSARQIWLNRVGIALIIVWVLFLLWLFGMCTLFLGMSAYGNLKGQVQWVVPPRTALTRPFQYPSYHYEVRVPMTAEDENERLTGIILMAVLAGGLGILTGSLFAVLLWHCDRWQELLAFAPPLIGVGFAVMMWENDRMTVLIRDWGTHRLLYYLLGECAAVALGLWTGRRIARLSLRILLPPKLLQHLSFLWTRDGKKLRLNNAEFRVGSPLSPVDAAALPGISSLGPHS